MGERFTIQTIPAGAALDLGNDTGRRDVTIVAPSCLPAPEFIVTTTHYINPERSETRGLGVQVAPYMWLVARTHATLALSLTFERDHIKALCDGFSKGQFLLTRTVAGVQMRSVGSLVKPECIDRTGVRTIWKYTWHGTPFGP